MKKLNLHIAAPKQYETMKSGIEKYQENPIPVEVTGWEYSFDSLAAWASVDGGKDTDVLLMFDTAHFTKDVSHDKRSLAYYSHLLTKLKETMMSIDVTKTKCVMILTMEEDENVPFLNELFKLQIYDIYFLTKQFNTETVANWVFSARKSLKDNEKYIITGVEQAQPSFVIKKTETKIEYIEKEVVKEVMVPGEDKIIGKTAIAVYGSRRGVGTTETAMMIAETLAGLNHKLTVGLVEYNGSTDLEGIELKRVTIFTRQSIGHVLQHNHLDYIVIDFGILIEKNMNGKIKGKEVPQSVGSSYYKDYLAEFHRCQLKICVLQIKPWQMQEALYCLGKGTENIWEKAIDHNYRYLLTGTNEKDARDFQNTYQDRKIYRAPNLIEHYETKRQEFDETIHEMLQDILPLSTHGKGMKRKLYLRYLKKGWEIAAAIGVIAVFILIIYYLLYTLNLDPISALSEIFN